jgi:predicted DNA-binding protein
LSKRNICQLRESLKFVIKKNNDNNDLKELKKNNIRINEKKTRIKSLKKRLKTKSTIAKTIIQVNIYEMIIRYLAKRSIANVSRLLQSSFNLTNEKIY